MFVQDAAEMDDFGGRQIKEFFLLQAAQYFNGKELLSFLCGFRGTEELQEQLLPEPVSEILCWFPSEWLLRPHQTSSVRLSLFHAWPGHTAGRG